MRKESDEQPWLLGLRAWVPHGGEDGHLLPEVFWQMKLGTLVMLVTLQRCCKSLRIFMKLSSALYLCFRKVSLYFKGLFSTFFFSFFEPESFLPVSATLRFQTMRLV